MVSVLGTHVIVCLAVGSADFAAIHASLRDHKASLLNFRPDVVFKREQLAPRGQPAAYVVPTFSCSARDLRIATRVWLDNGRSTPFQGNIIRAPMTDEDQVGRMNFCISSAGLGNKRTAAGGRM